MNRKRRALFLDRDGTINIDRGYTHKMEELEFVSGIPELINRYNEAGWLVIVVTNQAGIARGYYTEEDVETFHRYMNQCLKKIYGAHIDSFYYCPHHPEYGRGQYKRECNCRKPKTGMIDKAAVDWNIDVSQSILIGDKKEDILAGMQAGISHCYYVSDVLNENQNEMLCK